MDLVYGLSIIGRLSRSFPSMSGGLAPSHTTGVSIASLIQLHILTIFGRGVVTLSAYFVYVFFLYHIKRKDMDQLFSTTIPGNFNT